ncbi:transglycosylase domain-containing protein, partial [uncultured Desulfovibrio sp.]|uniref:transglycosylase domain-containing protein n=1 Tax=uncultured Desulfovibrio sp. TaxID=167968 RepID=UPI0026117A70
MKLSRILKRTALVLLLLIFLGGLGAAGVVATLFYWASRDLPDLDRLISYDAPQATTILARDGSILGTLAHEKRYDIKLTDMSRYLPMAFLAAEDDNFYTHPGIDIVAIIRA